MRIKKRYDNGHVVLKDGTMILADYEDVASLTERLNYIQSLYDSYHADVSPSSQEWVSTEFFNHSQNILHKEANAIQCRIEHLRSR